MATNAECEGCGVTAADLPYEDLDMTLDDASDLLFEQVSGVTYCQGCAQWVNTDDD